MEISQELLDAWRSSDSKRLQELVFELTEKVELRAPTLQGLIPVVLTGEIEDKIVASHIIQIFGRLLNAYESPELEQALFDAYRKDFPAEKLVTIKNHESASRKEAPESVKWERWWLQSLLFMIMDRRNSRGQDIINEALLQLAETPLGHVIQRELFRADRIG